MTQSSTMPSRRLRWSAWEQITLGIAFGLMVMYFVSLLWAIAVRPKIQDVSIELYRGCACILYYHPAPNWARLASNPRSGVLFYSELFQVSNYGTPAELSSEWHEKLGLILPNYYRFEGQTFKSGTVICPIWLLAWLLGILLWIQAKRRSAQTGLCIVCGYNLTGNFSGRCPECGTGFGGALNEPAAKKLSNK